jgi:Protein of unknown function (DUF3592)
MRVEVYGGTGWTRGSRRSGVVLGVFLAVGLGMLTGSGYSFLHTRAAIARAIPADGAVVDLISSTDSDGDTVYYPRVRFRTQVGGMQEFTGSVGSRPAAFDVGEGVRVLYDPERPGDARIDTFFQLWFLPLLLGGMGVIFAGIGAAGIGAGRSGRAAATRPETTTAAVAPTRAVERRSRD